MSKCLMFLTFLGIFICSLSGLASDQAWPVGSKVIYKVDSEIVGGTVKKITHSKEIVDYDSVRDRYSIYEHKLTLIGEEEHVREFRYWRSYQSSEENQAELNSCEEQGGDLVEIQTEAGSILSCHTLTTNCGGWSCELDLWKANIPFGVIKWNIDVRDGGSRILTQGEVVELTLPE